MFCADLTIPVGFSSAPASTLFSSLDLILSLDSSVGGSYSDPISESQTAQTGQTDEPAEFRELRLAVLIISNAPTAFQLSII